MTWQKVLGHEQVKDRILAALGAGRLAHAYLFVGPDGVGKQLLAIELAKCLLCERNPDGLTACDQCAACRLVGSGTHPDLVIASKPADKHDFPIELIQELIASLALKPARGNRRITIVDDVDAFNEQSANCFLKTLEEPPTGSLLILIGTDAAFQLSTIRSRCQIMTFGGLADDRMAERLRQAGVEDATQMRSLLRMAAGSPGLAIALADAAIWPIRRQIMLTMADPKPDGPSLASHWQEAIEAGGKESAVQRPRAQLLIRLALDVVRLALRVSMNESEPNTDPDEVILFKQIAQRYGTDGLLDLTERCLDAELHIDRFMQLKLAVEAFVDALTLRAPPRLRNPHQLGV